jgi:aryl-phospho-beta-D-glucosidase BglC (GH1 family)
VSSYRAWTSSQRAESQRIAAAVQAQNRAQQYAYIVDYNNRLFSQQQRYANMSFDYYNDPYFYSAPSYRYLRDGAYYTVNQYGVNMLQTAINDGYGEGYRAGRADRMDGWRADYRSNWVYQNASYGYNGYYLDRGEYSYYFRQGFRRGYEDGYYSRYQYGSYQNGSYSILGAVVNTILGLQSYDRY